MSLDKSQFVTPTQLAKMLGITRIAIHQKIKKGEIKAENIGDPSKLSLHCLKRFKIAYR